MMPGVLIGTDQSQIEGVVVKEKSGQMPTVHAVLELGGSHSSNIKKANHEDLNFD